MNIPKKSLSALFGAAIALSLTGCITLDEPTLSDAPASSEPVDAPESESPEENGGVGKFGQVVSWEGVDLTVTKPKAFEPSDTAGGQWKFVHTVSMDVKLTNTGDDLLDPTLVYVSASSGGEEGTAVFDVANGIDVPPTTDIQPGKSVKWTVAFNVADPKDMTVEVTPPDFMMEPVLFSTGG